MRANRTGNNEIRTERQMEIIKTLKSMIFPLIMCLLIGVGIYVIINFQNVEEGVENIPPRAFATETDKVVMENDALKFEMDTATTQFEVTVKSSGKVWKSNPDGGADDPLAQAAEKGRLQSPIYMTYALVTGNTQTYDSFNFSTKNGIYEIEEGDGYIKVLYSFGKVQKEFILPPVITKTNYDAWTSKMDDKSAKLCGEYYKKYDINKLSKKDADKEEELRTNYPIIETEVIYVLRDTTKDATKNTMANAFEAAGYTYDDYIADKELDLSEATNDTPIFNISIVYKLDGKDLVVEVPFNELEYNTTTPLYTINVLPYFGAAGREDEGFLLVPEGGGATINFNNDKVSQSAYFSNVYGWDMCLGRDSLVHETRAYYNVFGVSNKNDSFICVIEDGQAYAGINADISGLQGSAKVNSYNYVNAVYSINQREKYDVGNIANSDIYEYFPENSDDKISQRYSFVDSGSYVDMAKDYGNYLESKYSEDFALLDDAEAPVAVEIIGAVDKVKQIVGVPVSRPLKLTTFDEASAMITTLKADGFNNMSVKYSGWANGGVQQKLLKDIDVISSLGGKKGLTKLTQTANDAGVDLYLNGITQYAKDSNIFDGFFSFRDAAKLISKERVDIYPYSHITYAEREGADPYYMIHTELAADMVDNLVAYSAKMNAGVSFEDVGQDLSSDFYRKKTYYRQAVLNLQADRLKEISDSGQNIMINMGNDYAVPYVDMITNMDLSGSEYTILDEGVPFYQIAIHGHVNYTGEPLNICGDEEDEILDSVKYGAGLQFTFMDESAFTLQKTLYTEYYGADYNAWHEKAVALYTRYNNELGHTFNQEIVDFANITDAVSVTVYEDGTKAYVNYSYEDFTAEDGTLVPARDYAVVKK